MDAREELHMDSYTERDTTALYGENINNVGIFE